ncbi:MAG: hypothetical protein PHH98_02070 [Candidatus Gracilibacteria bacterium]|nr:hypothetical protein [Candidatus Gracilibacteria bacterium]
MNAGINVLDRIEQSFLLFKKGIKVLVIPFFVYYFISYAFFTIISIYFLSTGIVDSISETMNYNNFFLLFNNPKVILLLVVAMFFGLIYLVIYIPFVIYAIRTIKNLYNDEVINYKENVLYSENKFFEIMKTYWYIFAYVALIPSLFFIVGGGIFNLGYFLNWDDAYKIIGGFLMGIGIFLFIAFSLYRGIKTTFAVSSAIDCDEYTIENFKKSVSITDNNWWRIIGNVILVGIIISLLSGVAKNIFSIFFSSSSGIIDLVSNYKDKDAIANFLANFSYFNYFISGFFDLIISTIGKIFTIIFIYVFYKRLDFEKNGVENKEKSVPEEKIMFQSKNIESMEL